MIRNKPARLYNRTSRIMLCLLVLVGVISTPVSADTGEHLFQEKLCHSCHGDGGKTKYPNYPNLAGHDKMYIMLQFQDIRDRIRNNGLTILMNTFPTVKTITEEQIKAIADYLSKLD